jgi:putative tricarboxylic transport membrane protein
MSDATSHGDGKGPSQRAVETGTALAILAFGLLVIAGSLQVGVGWGAEGPRSGFFPFYMGLILVLTSLVNAVRAWLDTPRDQVFAGWTQLGKVLAVVIPTAVYVLVIPWIGIYIASAVLIAGFMMWLGNYRAPFALAVACGIMAATYLTFEKWFLVPLPKGPIEHWLGL